MSLFTEADYADMERRSALNDEFVTLETKYRDWFTETNSFIDEYFIDNDVRNDFVRNCDLPEHIKIECMLIKAKFKG